MVIVRRPLRDDVRAAILELLASGALPIAANVNEPELAVELGVSRTPLREALLGLEHEGLLVNKPGRGWVVAPLTPEVVYEVYPIIWALETEALRSCDLAALRERTHELTLLNAQLRRETDPVERMRLDDRWHEELLSACPNRRLLDLIGAQKRIVHRYEFAYMSEPRATTESADQHGEILAALGAGDLDRALECLEQNWRQSVAGLRDLMEQSAVEG